jgi:hypothetical protein
VRTLLFIAPLLLAACASIDGRDLVPGQSTEAQAVAEMGAPSQQVDLPGGGKALYFSRLPYGRAIYKASFDAQGVLRGVEQTLVPEKVRGIEAGKTTKEQVRELLGPPYRTARGPIKPLEVWEYWWRIAEDRRILWVSFSDDGVAREVLDMHDYQSDPPSGRDRSK